MPIAAGGDRGSHSAGQPLCGTRRGRAGRDWRILGLIIAMLGVGVGMENCGLIENIVQVIAPYLVALSPLFALGVVYILSSIITES